MPGRDRASGLRHLPRDDHINAAHRQLPEPEQVTSEPEESICAGSVIKRSTKITAQTALASRLVLRPGTSRRMAHLRASDATEAARRIRGYALPAALFE
jgi:hypothetical protein